MNIKQIKQLAQVINEQGLTTIEVSEGDTKIRLEKTAPFATPVISTEVVPPQTVVSATVNDDKSVLDFNKITEIKSPMVGVFYASPAPDKPPFVEIGTKVKKGDVLCIIEAMKLMNEITADADGEIVDICVGNGQVVEFSQVLFKLF